MCRSEMNATSIVTRPTRCGTSSGVSSRALTPSRTRTRGSLRRRQSSWPRPTSSAMTLAAPRCSSTSVNPPVDAPTSSAWRPRGSIANASSAPASFTPPRPTYGMIGHGELDARVRLDRRAGLGHHLAVDRHLAGRGSARARVRATGRGRDRPARFQTSFRSGHADVNTKDTKDTKAGPSASASALARHDPVRDRRRDNYR